MARSVDKNLKKLSLGAVRPTGWLLDQMKLMNSLQKRLGGLMKSDEWERGENLPRYIRGVVLLAAALDDKVLRDKAASCVQTLLNSGREGGDFGPADYRALSPRIEALKALLSYYEMLSYYELPGGERIMAFLKRYFKHQFNNFDVTPSWFNSRARLLDEIVAMEAVYRESDKEWLHDLGEKLRDATTEWFKLAEKFPYKKPASKYISQNALKRIEKMALAYDKVSSTPSRKLKPFTPELVEKQWKKQSAAVETDGVNIAKAIKYPATYGRFIGDDSLKHLSLKFLKQVMKYHGTPAGMFTCDMHLAGTSPSRGIDVQAAVEMIESLVEVIRETGDHSAADLLERIVFNVIPAACFPDCSAVQDVVLINQEEASKTRQLPGGEEEFSNAFIQKKLSRGAIAVLSAYPLYLEAACLVKDNELNFFTYTPCTMELSIDGSSITLSEKTGYPFRNTVVYKVEQATSETEVKINFRVPKNTSMQVISGGQVVASGTKEISVKCVLRTGSTFMLKMGIPLTVEDNEDGTVSLFKGNLLMSYKLPFDAAPDVEDRRFINVNFAKKWNIAPMLSRRLLGGVRTLHETETTIVHDFTAQPFSYDVPPFELQIRAKNVMNWDYDVNGFTQIPKRPNFSEESLERTFIPFGCTLLHIAQFPRCNK